MKLPNLRIRDALPVDVEAMAEISIESLWEEYKNLKEAEKAFKGPVASRWREMIRRGSGITLIAEKDGQVAGFLIFRWWFGWNGWLEVIAVKREYRGEGIGTKLMEALIRRAREKGYTRICFAVKQKETLARFYRKFNAKPFGEMPDEELGKIILYYIPL